MTVQQDAIPLKTPVIQRQFRLNKITLHTDLLYRAYDNSAKFNTTIIWLRKTLVTQYTVQIEYNHPTYRSARAYDSLATLKATSIDSSVRLYSPNRHAV